MLRLDANGLDSNARDDGIFLVFIEDEISTQIGIGT